ncbi:cytochrome b [Chenggangzhangella methanolivorans]|uniref:cytochrome b n=2 Tax=Chenggangzhangella methanolivorans TaxID=1437009 RepID=UPI0036080618
MSGAVAKFSPLQRALHWSMALAILAMLFVGVGMTATVDQVRETLIAVHRPLGIAILILALLRIAVRLVQGAPELPAGMPEPMKLAAKLSHLAFYGLMIAMPIIGWAMMSAADYPIVLFGAVHLPPIVSPSRELHAALWTAHAGLALCFFALILLHLAAALFHALVRRDGVFQQMAGGRAPAE